MIPWPNLFYKNVSDPNVPQKSFQVLLCLHGTPFWSHSYHRLIPLLVRAGYRVVVPDLIGFGRSDKFVDHRKYSVELHKSSVHQLLDDLGLVQRHPGVKLTLVGHNWGALFGLGLAKAGIIF